MNKVIVGSLILMGLAGGAWATAGIGHDRGQRGERRIEHLKAELNLTPDQETKIRSAFEKMREKIQALREETQKSIAAVLTPEQRQKFEQMRERRHGKGQQQ